MMNKEKSTLDDWLEWQQSINLNEIDLSLDRINEVKDKIGFRQPEIDIFLVAGTNGKGTTVHLIESFLINKGLNVGVYTSPHLNKYNERVTFNRVSLKDEELIESFEEVEKARDGIKLTYFEYGTLAAFLSLSRFSCDAWVIEVGLGGRLDATNILKPSVSVITNIAIDHQEWLGNSLNKIATEKAGIISSNVPCVSAALNTKEAINIVAKKNASKVFHIKDDYSLVESDGSYQWEGNEETIEGICIPTSWAKGEKNNLATSLMTLATCNPKYLPDTNEINSLIRNFKISGRFQLIQNRVPWILDVAHNPNAATNFLERLESLNLGDKNIMVLSVMKDKDLKELMSIFKNIISKWVLCEMRSSRSISEHEIKNTLKEINKSDITVLKYPENAFDYAERISKDYNSVIVTGSFEVVGPAINWLGNKK